MKKSSVSMVVLLVFALNLLVARPDRLVQAQTLASPRTAFVHLFEWKWTDIANECENYLGPKGFAAVQVSPPQEHVQGSQWWTRYQPVSYQIASRSGTRAEFASMVARCKAVGVDIYVDAVINHMTGVGSGQGVAGSAYTSYAYPGNYQFQDFHHCGRNGTDDIQNYQDRWEVQNCELVNLADLNTGSQYVRGKIAAYLNDLIGLGVAGFRIDAAKHMDTNDIKAIRSLLNGNPYIYQEVIDQGGEPITAGEYFQNGTVTEFKYSREIGNVFSSGQLSALSGFGPSWGFIASDKAVVFTDNHDNQRGHGGGGHVLTYKDGALYTLSNVFELAWPYGYPQVMSSYEFSTGDQGPPASSVYGGGTGANCFSEWKCEHRWRPIGNMVGFRNATASSFFTANWWSNGNNQIAFSRGDKGFVAINREGGALSRTFQTGMAAGNYCDVIHGDFSNGACSGPIITVNGSGQATVSVPSMDAVAIHVNAVVGGTTPTATAAGATATAAGATATPPTPTSGSSAAIATTFNVYAQTVFGENIFVVGSIPALGSWNTSQAVALSSASYPTWSGTINLPPATAIEYKYIKKNASGAVTWESNANRSFTTPVNALVILNNTWGTLTSPPPTIIPATAVPTTPPTAAPTGTATATPTSGSPTAAPTGTATATPGGQGVRRVKFQAGNAYVVVEILDDDLVHFEASALTAAPSTDVPLFTTPLVAKTNYPGPASFSQSGNSLETADLRLTVNPTSLCVTVHDKLKALTLTTTCPLDLTSAMKKMTMTPESMQNVYGLGQQFFREGANGDWTGRVRSPGAFGNVMSGEGANGGAVGNTQIPVMYALGANNANYAMYADQVYKQRWDFVANPWTFETEGEQVRWYVLSGPSLADLRQDYLELTGKPPVPPKKAFGLWVSEYGFDTWAELDGKLATLRTNTFPVDGFVLDLQWFGGINGSDATRMGSLSWDLAKFPNPAAKLASYKTTEGLGIIPIEESYIGKALPEHTDLANRGYLVRAGCATCAPVYLSSNPWWGKGGMIDWTSDAAGDYWHDSKRKALIDAGVTGHWIDLGEPEMFAANDWTQGVMPGKHDHASYHNIYNFEWAESIYRGYGRTDAAKRPFMLSRSGAAGIQRLGVAMWSGDIGSDLQNLASQQNVQMHMSMSGIDYFGSDIGGFHRGGDVNTSYTQWFANSIWTDVPIRPHTENLCNCKETAPDRIGDKAGNLANLRMRYELTPYYYSLAHRAALTGEPVVPPLVYHYQNDPNVRELGSQKLIGRDILVATTVGADTTQRDVYLPAGDWIDYYSNQWLHSAGQTFVGQPVIRNGKFQVPAYARAGAILPKMHIDDQTMNLVGLRSDGTTRNELIVRVYASAAATNFTLYEDDGETTAYQNGAVRTTLLSQQQTGTTSTVTIGAANGTYAAAPAARGAVVELVTDGRAASAVTLNGNPLAKHTSKAAFDAASSGWYNAGANLIVAKSAPTSVNTAQTFVFTVDGSVPTPTPASATATPTVTGNGIAATFNVLAQTVFGENIFVVGNVPALGSWNTGQAVALSSASYPTWSGTINLPPATAIEYKYIKKNASGAVVWESGSNRLLTTPNSGTATQNDTWR